MSGTASPCRCVSAASCCHSLFWSVFGQKDVLPFHLGPESGDMQGFLLKIECPCIDLTLPCRDNNVNITFNLSSLISRGYEVRSVKLSLTQAESGEVLGRAELEGEENNQYVMENISRPGDTLRLCLELPDREDVCRVWLEDTNILKHSLCRNVRV